MAEDNIFREVDEELRSDRMRALWRRIAPFVIGAAVAIVAIVAVNEGWAWYSNSKSAQSSQELYAALDSANKDDLPAAQAELDTLAANGSGGYPVLAEFAKASLLAKSGDSAGAVAAYDTLANDQSNVRLRELALLQAASILVDTGTLADVETRVGSIATDDNPMRRVARELIGLAQFKAGDNEAAKASFEAVLNDPLAQDGIRNRVAYYLAAMTSNGAIAPEAPADASTAADAVDSIIQGDEVTAPASDAAPAEATTPAETTTPDAPATTTTPAAETPAAEPAAPAAGTTTPPATQ
ncbi:hypothetical protein ASG47_02695 [Devosia sp. Leaf420]|uniref:tetratricopeptide repeat protein n=1 Tax=Devosia sp. Leaf420 TaxID=1736374 RepID=UPI000712D46D|nr:tetratricopeptide repeat protein [Devosia sp. Leaf420]KQT51809.1 hypothetical protein ASG47_02695 [Devosia sp. Leaf420]